MSGSIKLLVIYDKNQPKNLAFEEIYNSQNNIENLDRYFSCIKFIQFAENQICNIIKENSASAVLIDIEALSSINIISQIKEKFPNVKIIILTDQGGKNHQLTIDSLMLGVEDFIEKPTNLEQENNLYKEIINKFHLFKNNDENDSSDYSNDNITKNHIIESITKTNEIRSNPIKSEPTENKTIKNSHSLKKTSIKAIAIASSTGGPKALATLLKDIGKFNKLNETPIFITQHMPAGFTTKLAETIDRIAGRPCVEASDQEIIRNDHIYIAPGNYHMTIEGNILQRKICLNQNPAENYCRPAADVMIRSLLKIYKEELLIIILTGMGNDGLKSSIKAKNEYNNIIIAQDEESSVVWGMPGAVANAGICNEILPIDKIKNKIEKLIT